MLLAIDLGNTTIVIGVFAKGQLINHWRISTRYPQSADEMGALFLQLLKAETDYISQLKSAVISSVVPPLTDSLVSMCRRYFKLSPLLVDSSVDLGLQICYDNLKEVGADRLVNAVAAYKQHGAPLIIVDFGTATTFCALNSKGNYLGGAICPGVEISAQALYSYTAQLPKVDVIKPDTVIGKNTVDSLHSGLFYGCISSVDGMIERIGAELGGIPKVVATGGLADKIGHYSKYINIIEPWLTLQGLYYIHQRNQGDKNP